jgi:hemoglobin/transferrin/lactoferrin receptor protein
VGPGNLVYGFDYYRDDVNSSGSRNNAAGTNFKESLPVADDSSYDLFGVYSQYQWDVNDKLQITPGLRYTYAGAKLGRFTDSTGAARTNESDSWDSVVGSLRGLYRIDDNWSLFGGISQAFRSPNLDDLSGNLASKSGITTLGSLDVNPEEFITYEIGGRRSSDDFSMQAAVFYTDIDDVITGVPETSSSNNTITTNGGDGYVYGVELEGVWNFRPQWSLSGFAAWQSGREETPDFIGGPRTERPMTRQLPLTGSVALRWTSESGDYWVEGRVLGATQEDRITAADQASDNQRIPTGGTPGYLVTSLRAGWQVNDSLDLTCGVENLTDQDYRNHGSGQNEPGLNVILGARVSW